MKRCGKCGIEKDGSEFGKDSAARDGLQRWCRACVKAYDAEAFANPNHPAHGSRIKSSEESNRIRREQPEHPITWSHRESAWRRQLIECLPGCLENEGYLCRWHYQALREFQAKACGLCSGTLYFIKPYPAADHHHRDPDGRGPIRGILHGGKNSCNIRILAHYERGHVPSLDGYLSDQDRDCMAYLADPPAARLARAIANGTFPDPRPIKAPPGTGTRGINVEDTP